MITDRIKALFQFIEFLHSNIANFKQYDEVLDRLHLLGEERNKVRPRNNFAEKLRYDEIQLEINEVFPIIQEKIIQPILAKAAELNICDPNKTETLWNWNISEIHNLKENFKREDLPEILNHKRKYLEFRKETNSTYFLGFFFGDLDEILKQLFDFFKESDKNEFESFEEKAIKANNIQEAGKLFQQGVKKIILPNDFLNPSTIQQEIKIDSLQTPLEKEKLRDLITHEKSIEIVEGIKTQYKNIKGKRLKLLLMALQDLNLLPKERIAQKFYDCCKEEFGWNIASYTAMNDYKFNDMADKNELDNMKKYLETLIR